MEGREGRGRVLVRGELGPWRGLLAGRARREGQGFSASGCAAVAVRTASWGGMGGVDWEDCVVELVKLSAEACSHWCDGCDARARR